MKYIACIPLLALGFAPGTSVAQEQSFSELCATWSQYKAQPPMTPAITDTDCFSLGAPPIFGTDERINEQAQYIHKVKELRASENVTGAGVAVGVWDGGWALPNHVELVNRISFGEDPTKDIELGGHATHVAGTVGAKGILRSAQGMAPDVSIRTFDWNDDIVEMAGAADAGVVVSNHSYGIPGGWEWRPANPCGNNWVWMGSENETNDGRFGLYDGIAARIDDVALSHPTLTVVVAAGNERGGAGDPHLFVNDSRPLVHFDGSHCVWNNGWTTSTVDHPGDSSRGGYWTITSYATAKNAVVVGASIDLPSDFDASAVDTTDFSSWGPIVGGRIKPDVVANGDKLYSSYIPERCETGQPCHVADVTLPPDLQQYYESSGTSMATPATTGILALLNEHSTKVRGTPLYSDEAKAALIHTVVSPTFDGRPTYRYGWGIIEAQRAGLLLGGKEGTLTRHQIASKEVQTFDLPEPAGGRDVRVTLVWLDPPGAASGTDLIEDLDMRIVSPDGRAYFPWSLSAVDPTKLATNSGPNSTDNVEVIDLPTNVQVASGWHIEVDASKLSGASIHYALAVN